MHTVIEPYCTGCELCLPVCPVDCIAMENVTGPATGWSAWSPALADKARNRYEFRSERLRKYETQRLDKHATQLESKLTDLPAHSRIADPAELDKKRLVVQAALDRARAKLK